MLVKTQMLSKVLIIWERNEARLLEKARSLAALLDAFGQGLR